MLIYYEHVPNKPLLFPRRTQLIDQTQSKKKKFAIVLKLKTLLRTHTLQNKKRKKRPSEKTVIIIIVKKTTHEIIIFCFFPMPSPCEQHQRAPMAPMSIQTRFMFIYLRGIFLQRSPFFTDSMICSSQCRGVVCYVEEEDFRGSAHFDLCRPQGFGC